MSKVHEVVAEDLYNDLMKTEGGPRALHNARRTLRAGEADPDMLAVIGQTFVCHPGDWPEPQLTAALMINAEMNTGRFVSITLDVGRGPHADDERAENQAVLNALPAPFTAEVDMIQNGDDHDGWLSWAAPFEAGNNNTPNRVTIGVYPSGQAGIPLEIGYTQPSVTLNHLVAFGHGVARWPYGSPAVTLLLNTEVFGPTLRYPSRGLNSC